MKMGRREENEMEVEECIGLEEKYCRWQLWRNIRDGRRKTKVDEGMVVVKVGLRERKRKR